MGKLWAGRFSKEVDSTVNDFNSSIPFDSRMYKQDMEGSIAHATMLGIQNIIDPSEAELIVVTLKEMIMEIDEGTLKIDMTSEDIHTFVEAELTSRIGDTGKRLHTARSRNDQVALDVRLYLRDECASLIEQLKELVKVLCDKAIEHKNTVLPGYTHMQRAQPIVFGHHLLAYASMFSRDISRLEDASKRMNYSPLGCGALAGTSYNIDRYKVAELLNFDGITQNSLDGVADRDFCVELASALSLVMVHLSRFSEEIILWCSWEFKFIELDDAFATGSSIMPQKKNPDIAELVRGKTGRVFGDLMTLLTMLKGLPLAYNKDMQEDKEPIFDACETVKNCLDVFTGMIKTMTAYTENMEKAAQKGFINATDLADYLTLKGIPFRSSYKISGQIVSYCIKNDKVLETLTLDEYKSFSEIFEEDIYEAVNLKNCVDKRNSLGGTSVKNVEMQISEVKKLL